VVGEGVNKARLRKVTARFIGGGRRRRGTRRFRAIHPMGGARRRGRGFIFIAGGVLLVACPRAGGGGHAPGADRIDPLHFV
jgi:hypothetical protein